MPIDVSETWPLSLLHHPARAQPVPTQEPASGGGSSGRAGESETDRSRRSSVESIKASIHGTWTKKIFPNLPKTVDTIIACLGESCA
jgi:hypothetical protein